MQSSLQLAIASTIKPLLSVSGFLLLSIALLFYIAYSDTFAELLHYWIDGYNWQFLIPIALVYMLWERRDLLRSLEYRPSIFLGTTLLILGCAILIAGQVSSTHTLREISVVVSVFALAWLLFGTDFVRKLFWPLAYLILMTSLPSDLLEKLREPLKLISATVAADALQIAGYVVYREGTFLHLPHIVLEVADSCSGLNQLTSSVALGIPIAFTILNQSWKRAIVILVACAMALVMNWIRVFLISIWHYNSAKDVIHGPYGIYELPFIFLVGVFITLFVAMAIAGKNDTNTQPGAQSNSVQLSVAIFTKRFSIAAFSAIAVLSITSAYLFTWNAKPVYLQADTFFLPVSVAGYQGKPIKELGKPFHTGLAHDEIIMRYSTPAGEKADVYIGYFHSQDQEKELIDYRYNWLHEDAKVIELPSASPAISMKTNIVKTKSGPARVFFAYDINRRNIVDIKMAKLVSLFDAAFERRNNGAIIIVRFYKAQELLSDSENAFLSQILAKSREILSEGG